MAEKKRKPPASIQTLTPNSFRINADEIDSKILIVPKDRFENAFLSALTAARLRMKLLESIKKWEDEGNTPTPKELADLAKAARDIATFAAEVYAVDIEQPAERKTEAPTMDDVNFNDLVKAEMPLKPKGAIDITEIEVKKDEQPDQNAETHGSGS